MSWKRAADYEVSMTIRGTEEIPPELMVETLEWMLEMNGGIDSVENIEAEPINPELLSGAPPSLKDEVMDDE